MAKSFIDAYYEAPDEVKLFLYSDDFYAFLDEYVKKFEIKDEVNFVYLLQDLALKIIEPNENLKEIIKSRLNLGEENANQLAFHIKTKFMPLFENLWQEQKETKSTPQLIKQEIPKQIVDLVQQQKEVAPQKILNLQKIIPPKQEETTNKEENPVDLSSLKPIKTEIPKTTVDIKQSISWEPPKPERPLPSNIVIIKKEPEKKEKDENILDLSNL